MLPELACYVGFMSVFSVLFCSTINLFGPYGIVDFTVISFMFQTRTKSTRPFMVKKTEKKKD